MKSYLVSEKDLTKFVAELFKGYGITDIDAMEFAEALINADLCNVTSHGTVRVKTYLEQIKSGKMDITVLPEMVKENGCTAVIDGRNGLGMITSARATLKAKELAEKHGVGIVAARGCNHFGRAGYWATKLSGDNCIGFTTSNTTPILSAPASNQRIIGSNPFSFAIPAGKYGHVCLDISNGIMAMGKIYNYARENKPLPGGAWIDAKGNPTTDPRANDPTEYTMRPVGAHKGFGLAVVMEMITSILAMGTFCPRSALIPESEDRGPALSQLYVAVKVDSFRDIEDYEAAIEDFIEYLHTAPVNKEGDKIFFPGEIEEISIAKNRERGITLPEDIVEFLKSAASEVDAKVDNEIFEEM